MLRAAKIWAASIALGCIIAAPAEAVSPATVVQGRALFEQNWTQRNPQFGGDGLGPLFNAQSCVACHHQGGVGGSGDARFNANTLAIEYMKISGGMVDNDVTDRRVERVSRARSGPGVMGGGTTLRGNFTRETEGLFRRDKAARLTYAPTKFNQEWRTPPLWGLRDSAPYMHDGRAETVLESIVIHDGESAGTRDRFLQLSLADRHAILAFLDTLVAPPGVPQMKN